MDHLHVLGTLVPSDRALFDRAGPYDVRALPDGRVMGCKLNVAPAVMEREGLMNSALKLDARIPRRPLPAFAGTYARLMVKHRQLRPSYFGWSELAAPTRRFAEFATHLQIELAPVPSNRVTLSAERDRLGRPLPSVSWRWDELSRRSVHGAARILAASLARAGLGRLDPRRDALPLPERARHQSPHRRHANPHGSEAGRGRRELQGARRLEPLYRRELGVPDRRLRESHADDHRASDPAGGSRP